MLLAQGSGELCVCPLSRGVAAGGGRAGACGVLGGSECSQDSSCSHSGVLLRNTWTADRTSHGPPPGLAYICEGLKEQRKGLVTLVLWNNQLTHTGMAFLGMTLVSWPVRGEGGAPVPTTTSPTPALSTVTFQPTCLSLAHSAGLLLAPCGFSFSLYPFSSPRKVALLSL